MIKIQLSKIWVFIFQRIFLGLILLTTNLLIVTAAHFLSSVMYFFSAPVKTKFNIYVACVKSILLYNSSIWYPAISDLHKMEALQKRAFKWVFGRRDYRDTLISVGSLPICYELLLSDLILFSKLLQGFYEFDFSDYVTMAYKRPGLRSDSRMDFQLHPFKRFHSRLSYFHRTVNNAIFLCIPDINFWAIFPHLNLNSRNFYYAVYLLFLIVIILVHIS